jgi:predicted transcriptional regulator
MQLAKELKKLRMHCKMSQRQFALELGCCQTTISHYEKAIRCPSRRAFSTILAVANRRKYKRHRELKEMFFQTQKETIANGTKD